MKHMEMKYIFLRKGNESKKNDGTSQSLTKMLTHLFDNVSESSFDVKTDKVYYLIKYKTTNKM
ncbi:hypothetical protein [Senegalia massiliensis]|uniref:Uncharacterized protein n=1 Tax=Senegalia massiliensis TaxID=1720316 RepID=A0A845R0J2_9CLOT|nr:hypothetical protein [Senegalia massiliensis]NBI06103.1 hypothetical protein [Senegalia massiliensis]